MSQSLEGFHPAAFTRANNEPDAIFFAQRQPDTLMDMGARTAVTALYRTALPEAGTILDLMSGAFSHYPDDIPFEKITGLGINLATLEANSRLTERLVHDLNTTPALPFEDGTFDAVTLCDGFAYLTAPLTVLQEITRVLRPGGSLVVTFSDNFHGPKAVAMWQALEAADRIRLLSALMARADLIDLDTGEVTPPEDLTAWKDSVYAIIGRKSQAE